MAEVNEAAVRAEVERILPALREKSEDDLRAEVGQLVLGNEVMNPEREVTEEQLVEAGEDLVQREDIRALICKAENRERLTETLSAENIAAFVSLLLSVLRIKVKVPVTAIAALAVLLLKIGLNEYCENGAAT
jgi:hypothetical protein